MFPLPPEKSVLFQLSLEVDSFYHEWQQLPWAGALEKPWEALQAAVQGASGGQVAEERGDSATNTACPARIKDTQLARFYKKENYIKEINVKKKKKPFLLVY